MKKEVVSIRKVIPHYKNMLDGNHFASDSPVDVVTVSGDYSLLVTNQSTGYRTHSALVTVKPNTAYTFIAKHTGAVAIFSGGGTLLSANYSNAQLLNFNSLSNTTIRIYFRTPPTASAQYENWLLAEGEFIALDFEKKNDSRIKERLKDNGTVQEIRIRFYPGVERTLKVRPYILHKAGRAEDLFTYPSGTDPYITGDDDYLEFSVLVDFEYDDEIVVEYENTGNYPYTLSCDIVVNYYREEGI